MEINKFVSTTRFSIKKIIDFNKMAVSHFIQDNKESDLDVLDEDAYNDLIKFLRNRLKLVKRFEKTDDNVAEETSFVFIASSNEIGEMLDTFTNTLSDEQKQQTIKYFKD